MATITVTTPRHIEAPDPDLFAIDFHDNDPWKRNLPELLILLGQKLIQHELHDNWLSMGQVTKYCRQYNLRWKHGSPKAKELEMYAADYFSKAGDVRGGGVKVEAKSRYNENRRQELFLKFIKLYPDGTCA